MHPLLENPGGALTVGTHDGSWHADDVFACATVRLAHPGRAVRFVRTRDRERLAVCDVRVDVGGRHSPSHGDFDHHQPRGAGARPDGAPYAAFGLAWAAYGPVVCGGDEALAQDVDRLLVRAIDAHDTGHSPPRRPAAAGLVTIVGVISSTNPTWEEETADGDTAFDAAVALAQTVIERQVAQRRAATRARELVRRAIASAEDPRLIVLPRSVPWRGVVINEAPRALLVVHPARGRSWRVRAIQEAMHRAGQARLPLPAAWAGRQGRSLARATGVPDAVFCHAGAFVAEARSLEGALALARAALASRHGLADAA